MSHFKSTQQLITCILYLQKEVRAQDSVFVIVSVALNPRGRDMTWEFFKTNSAQLLEQYEVNDCR